MSVTQVDGSRQIKAQSIADAQISSSAAIATSKLSEGAEFIKRGGTVAFTADQPLGGFKLTGVGTPTSGTDAATKAYVDAAAAGIDWKASVRATTTAAGTFASSFANGSVIDGVTLVTGDRILIKDQASGSENGIYVVAASGAPARAADADTAAELGAGSAVFVEEGTSNADTGWLLTNNGTITLGTTALVFTQFTGVGSLVAGAGLTKTGNTVDVVAGSSKITVAADSIDVNEGNLTLTNLGGTLSIAKGGTGQTTKAPAFDALSPLTTAGDLLIGGASGTGTRLAAGATSGHVLTSNGSGAAPSWQAPASTPIFVDRETPSGLVNGSNTTYTLANTPTAGSEHVYLNGILQEPGAGNDYTISGGTITYLTAPVTGDKIRVTYRR